MTKPAKVLCFLIAFLSATTTAFSQQAFRDSLDQALTLAFNKTKLPGFTAVVVNTHGIIYQKSMGFADAQHHLPYTTSTIENIGSVSKTFVGVALMKAIDLGYFSLETNINDILPFKVINPYHPDAPITIRQLTNHTSGIIDNDSIYHRSYKFRITENSNKDAIGAMAERGYSGGLADTTLETFLQSYLATNGALYSNKNFYNSLPGARSSYSNIATALAAYLIELKAKMPFAAFSQKYILHPLHMTHSSWFLEDVNMQQHATPYAATDLPLPFYSLTTYPDGGLITSAEDLSKYVTAMISSRNKHAQIITQRAADIMFTPAFAPDHLPDNFNASKRTKGVFWNLYTDGFIGHDGDDPGVSTNILFNGNCGIIFMTNIYLDDRGDFLNPLKALAGRIAAGK